MAEEAPKENAAGAIKVLVDEVAQPFKKEISAALGSLAEGVARPKLVGFLANADPAAKMYATWTEKAFKRDGLDFELRAVDELQLEAALEEANEDPSVHGIMIYYPVFGSRPSFFGANHDDYLRDSVSPFKDVEGLCHFYRRSLYRNRRFVDQAREKKCILPCTPLAVVKTLDHLGLMDPACGEGNALSSKTISVINRSEVVGRPLAAMLANDGALVYSIDIDSVYLYQRGTLSVVHEDSEEHKRSMVQASDVVILGVPTREYQLDPSWVKKGAVVVNVSTFKNVDPEALDRSVRYVPQVGKVTVAMLERNLLRLHANFAGRSATLMGGTAP